MERFSRSLNSSAFYTNDLPRRVQSPGNINCARLLVGHMGNGNVDRTILVDKKVHPLKLIRAMPHRRPPAPVTKTTGNKSPAQRDNFRARYDDLEAKRAALVARLQMIGGNAPKHPGYRRALTLLNDTFRKSKLAQRLAVLQAASWLIDVLERVSIGL
jgi:hypothetical protein